MPRSANPNKSLPIYGHPALGLQKPIPPFMYVQDSFLNSGLDLHSRWPAIEPESLLQAQNVLVSQTGAFIPRPGFATFAKANIFGGSSSPNNGFTRLFTYQNPGTGIERIVCYSSTGLTLSSIKTDGTSANVKIADGTSPIGPVSGDSGRAVNSRGYWYFFPGVSGSGARAGRWDGGDATSLLVANFAPASKSGNFGNTITAASGGAGNVTLQFGRTYYCAFGKASTGTISDINPLVAGDGVSTTFGPCTSLQVNLTHIPSGEANVDQRYLFATADGGDQTVLYLLAIIPDNVTTTYTDNTPEATLLTNAVYQDIDANGVSHGVVDNARPLDSFARPVKHKGRLWAIDTSTNNYIYFSKSLDEITTADGTTAGRYEEAWPATNFIDISQEAEQVNALLSDGETLYIGTNKHIRRLTGDSPDNFSEPDVLFSNVGVRSDDAWTMVYVDGAPAGMVWMTPEGKLMGSDMNTYQNIGLPIQDSALNNPGNTPILASCPTTSGQVKYVNFGSYDLVFVSLGNQGGGTWAVYDLRNRQWYCANTFALAAGVADLSLPAPFFVHWGAGTSPLILGITDQYLTKLDYTNWPNGDGIYTVTNPRTVSAAWTPATNPFKTIVQTNYLDFGDGQLIKAINSIDLMAGNGAIAFSIRGANNVQDIGGADIVTVTPANNPISLNFVKVYLAGQPLKYRYYSLTYNGFVSNYSLTNPPATFWGGYRVDVVPIARL